MVNKIMTNKIGILVSLVLLIICTISVFSLTGFQNKIKNDEITNIKDTIIKAESFEAENCILPDKYNVLPDTIVPNDVINSLKNKSLDDASRLYSAKSGLLANRIKVSQMAIYNQCNSKDTRVINHKVTGVNFIKIEINGDTATVIADVTSTAKIIGYIPDGTSISDLQAKYDVQSKILSEQIKEKDIKDSNGKTKKMYISNPTNILEVYYNLEKENNTWVITSRIGDFLPGQEP